jgi:hypothetical protein
MPGFIPHGYQPLTAARDELGTERLGMELASGHQVAFAMDQAGTLKQLDETFWRREIARAVMEAGQIMQYSGEATPFGVREYVDYQPVLIAVKDSAEKSNSRGGRPEKVGPVKELLLAMYPEGVPTSKQMGPQDLDRAVRVELSARGLEAVSAMGLGTVSSKTVERARRSILGQN